ncbi:MAG: DNA-binding response regulator [Candidatus Fraserbacteria bacterium RBG_16_55_9]|uniref:DNA-binding response regulator n=1 Tax=Fraserbacteria sp. (strain RBG_16_55_9) TaxID=1817864 RepID=A0A1F5UUA0_FRAXR|nr:MAG: DNA-binding response regulator [Candidatus Fraserbacteria bacterium RBG_16_55_9]
MSKRILVVDDEYEVVKLVRAYLEEAGFRVAVASDGPSAVAQFATYQPALVILDLMLPGLDGLEVARRIRRGSEVPIIMLTARTDEADRVAGLELGADDYVIKPFSARELVSRVRAVLRRAEGGLPKQKLLEANEIRVDLDKHEVSVRGQVVELTPMEFDLLAFLMQHPGRVFTRLQLLEAVRGAAYESFDRSIDAHIKRLRQKIEHDPKAPRYVLTVFGVGYKFASPRDQL